MLMDPFQVAEQLTQHTGVRVHCLQCLLEDDRNTTLLDRVLAEHASLIDFAGFCKQEIKPQGVVNYHQDPVTGATSLYELDSQASALLLQDAPGEVSLEGVLYRILQS